MRSRNQEASRSSLPVVWGHACAEDDPGDARIRRSSVVSPKFVVAPRAARRPPGKARRVRISGIFERGATPPGGMHRRPNANELLRHDTSSPWLERDRECQDLQSGVMEV